MSGIIRRTVFRHKAQGTIILGDWARVTTEVGVCLEPFTGYGKVNNSGSQMAYDPTDQITRVDDMEEFPIGREGFLCGDAENNGTSLCGGALWPRTGF